MDEKLNADMSDFAEKTWRYVIFMMIFLVTMTAALIIIGYKTDFFYHTNFYSLKSDRHFSEAVSDNIYSIDGTNINIKSFSIENEIIRVEIGINNNGSSAFELSAKDISLIKYVDNKRDLDMIYYPENYNDTAEVRPGESGSLYLEYNVIRLEDKSSGLTYCIDYDADNNGKNVIFLCYDSYKYA